MQSSTQSVTDLIVLYTERLEELDHSLVLYIMTCMGTLGVVVGLIMRVAERQSTGVRRIREYEVGCGLSLAIPVIVTIFSSFAAIVVRKVAMYRGYLIYLENQYNEIEGSPFQSFNSNVLRFLSSYSSSNKAGSRVNKCVFFAAACYLSILLLASIGLFFHFVRRANKERTAQNKRKRRSNTVLIVTFLGVWITTLYVLYCCCMDVAIHSVNFSDVVRIAENAVPH